MEYHLLSERNMINLPDIMKIKELCMAILQNGNIEQIKSLGHIIRENRFSGQLQSLQRDLLATFYMILKNEAQNKSSLRDDHKLIVVDILNYIFSQTKVSNEVVFFNFFGFLLHVIYNSDTHEINNIQEEYKVAILSCIKSLMNSTSSDLTLTLYKKANGRKLCKMIYVAVELAKHEKFRTLRIEAIQCLMALFKVHSDLDYADVVLRSLVAECFSYFLPGVVSCLSDVSSRDETVGYKLIQVSVKATGRIMSLLMQDYSKDSVNNANLVQAKLVSHQNYYSKNSTEETVKSGTKKNIFDSYMEGTRNPEWFAKSDNFLSRFLMNYRKLTQHSITQVRKELSEMCCLLIQTCSRTIPKSQRYLVEILVILSEDPDSEVSQMCQKELNEIFIDQNKFLINMMYNSFEETFSEIPTVFNGIDEEQKLATLKLTTGYINILGRNLQLHDSFRKFLLILLHLCEFEVNTSIFVEYKTQDLDDDHDGGTSLELWKNLKFLTDDKLRTQFSCLCYNLVKKELFETVSDFLITTYDNEEEQKEATYFLNELILGLKNNSVEVKRDLIETIFHHYIDPSRWYLSVAMESDEMPSLINIKNNIQQSALNVYGIGIIADVLQENFKPFLMQSLFLVLTKAGSKQLFIRAAGKKALKCIANACNYSNVISLLNDNMDYFVFYIERGLKNDSFKGDVFDVMEVVITYGDEKTLQNLHSIVEEVLVLSCDKFKQKRIFSYLRIFQVFLKSVMRWFNVHEPSPVLKTKAQKKSEELQNFKVTGLDDIEEIKNFSDEIMDKSAEELYQEDMKLKKEQTEKENLESEDGIYRKPEPPYHIKLTVDILKRSLNFLPSKEQKRKFLVLKILRDGVEIIKDFEDELLPIVHLIWSPLVGRFRDKNDPVVISYSFQLLCTLGRVSKDFIRSRTAKDILPRISEILTELSRESYMKDRGSAYRYTQSYKLQMIILEKLAYLLADIDLMENDIKKTMELVFVYLNNKQPLPLQSEAVNFFKIITQYDPIFQDVVNDWLQNENNIEYMKNLKKIVDDSVCCSLSTNASE